MNGVKQTLNKFDLKVRFCKKRVLLPQDSKQYESIELTLLGWIDPLKRHSIYICIIFY
jgi:hypothetical protein